MTVLCFHRAFCALLLGVAGMVAVSTVRSSAQVADDLEAKVKSGFLLNFARYVEWPATSFTSSNSPVTIGVLGQDSLGRNLDVTVEAKTVEGHPVQVKRGRRLADLEDAHVIFIAVSERERLRSVLAELEGKAVLTVSEVEGFTAAGGMIQLKKTRQGTMRFDINKDAADKARLKISSKLLKLADNL